MYKEVPTISIVFMLISCISGLLIPILFEGYFYRKKKADLYSFIIGAGVFMLFGVILKNIFQSMVFTSDFAKASIIPNKTFFAGLGAAFAAIFEETGRLLAFLYPLKKYREKNQNALMYGAGHGGMESLIILTLGMVSNIYLAININNGNIDSILNGLSGQVLNNYLDLIDKLASTGWYFYLLGIIERVIAMFAQISMSVLVWFAVKNKKASLFFLSLGLHFLLDFVSLILSQKAINILIIELVILALTVLMVYLAKKIWDREKTKTA